MRMNATVKESIEIYGDGLREKLEELGKPPEEWDLIWGLDDDEIEEDAELQWLIGWFMGVAEAYNVLAEQLITLNEESAPAKKAPAKKKSPVAKKKKSPVRQLPAKEKSPVKLLMAPKPKRRKAS